MDQSKTMSSDIGYEILVQNLRKIYKFNNLKELNYCFLSFFSQGNNDDLILSCCTYYCKDKARDFMPKDRGSVTIIQAMIWIKGWFNTLPHNHDFY